MVLLLQMISAASLCRSGSLTERVAELTPTTVDDFLSESSGLCLVDFWAEWCRPCHALIPVLDELAGEGSGVHVGKVDVSEHTEVGDRFEIKSLPTIIIFRDGVPVSRLFGAKTLRQLHVALDRVDAGI
jgi:thioredoxin 1